MKTGYISKLQTLTAFEAMKHEKCALKAHITAHLNGSWAVRFHTCALNVPTEQV
jgi:hypothetical protein